VTPLVIVQRVKGRLQHLLHGTMSKPFRRNYSLRSIGSTRREKLEQYLATQLSHHPMADPRVQQRLEQYQIFRPEVDDQSEMIFIGMRDAKGTSRKNR
jgi:hypothetical protein